MLKKPNRLKTKSAFSATYYNNKVVSNELIVLYIGKLKNNEDYPVRVGFVVSKKVHKRAVKRNRIKRLMREVVRLIIKNDKQNIINNYQSLIFLAKPLAVDKNMHEIQQAILTLLDKLAI